MRYEGWGLWIWRDCALEYAMVLYICVGVSVEGGLLCGMCVTVSCTPSCKILACLLLAVERREGCDSKRGAGLQEADISLATGKVGCQVAPLDILSQ